MTSWPRSPWDHLVSSPTGTSHPQRLHSELQVLSGQLGRPLPPEFFESTGIPSPRSADGASAIKAHENETGPRKSARVGKFKSTRRSVMSEKSQRKAVMCRLPNTRLTRPTDHELLWSLGDPAAHRRSLPGLYHGQPQSWLPTSPASRSGAGVLGFAVGQSPAPGGHKGDELSPRSPQSASVSTPAEPVG
jgi:hypothetical protein